jgi:uncharacterized phage-like protein YoqJ
MLNIEKAFCGCCFLGHRDCPKSIKGKLLLGIENLIVNENVNVFYVGTQGAFDRLVYKVLCELEEKYEIKTKVVLAYLNRENEFKYYDANKTVFPDCVTKTPPRFAISKRNDYMLKNSDFLICYLDNKFSNTYEFVLKAIKKNIKIINLGSLTINNI